MLAGACNGHGIQNLKKVEVEHTHQLLGCALAGGKLAPCVKLLLCRAEDFLHAAVGVQLVLPRAAVALIRQRQLVAQVIKAVVDRRGGKHQHTGARTGADDLVHQLGVAVGLAVVVHIAAVAEVVAFVDHSKVVGCPVQLAQISFAGKPLLAT